MEYWDLYDANKRPLGRTHRRGEPVPEGAYHLGADVWTVNSRGQLLLTLRAPEKRDLPGEWENTCGSVLAGETPLEGALRELFEETGIRARPEELELLCEHVDGNTIGHSYLLRRDVALSELVFQPGETVAARWVTPEELDALVAQPTGARPAASRLPFVRERLYARVRAVKDQNNKESQKR